MLSAIGSGGDDLIRSVRRQDKAVIVELAGDVDLHSSPELREQLKQISEQRPEMLVINLQAVPYMDSSGVATLVESLQKVKKYGGQLTLVGLQSRVRSIFEIAKLTDIFQISNSEAEALGA